MTIIDESPATLLRARGITSLGPTCSHRFPDQRSAWHLIEVVRRWGTYSAWECQLCGAGDPDGYAYEASTKKECLA